MWQLGYIAIFTQNHDQTRLKKTTARSIIEIGNLPMTPTEESQNRIFRIPSRWSILIGRRVAVSVMGGSLAAHRSTDFSQTKISHTHPHTHIPDDNGPSNVSFLQCIPLSLFLSLVPFIQECWFLTLVCGLCECVLVS